MTKKTTPDTDESPERFNCCAAILVEAFNRYHKAESKDQIKEAFELVANAFKFEDASALMEGLERFNVEASAEGDEEVAGDDDDDDDGLDPESAALDEIADDESVEDETADDDAEVDDEADKRKSKFARRKETAAGKKPAPKKKQIDDRVKANLMHLLGKK